MSAIAVYDSYGHSTTNVRFSTYPDGSPRVEVSDEAATADTLVLRPSNMTEFYTGLYLADALAERGLGFERLVLGFVPGARQDRLTDGLGADALFTAKSVARDVNARGFGEVTLIDPHSDVLTGLIDHATVVSQADIIGSYWPVFLDDEERVRHIRPGHKIANRFQVDGVIAPDAGAGKKAFDVAQVMGVPVFQAFKHRDVATGKLSGFSVEPLERGKHYLVVDDICDGGGTFLGLVEEINKQGAVASLFITHGIFSKGTADLTNKFVKVFTTDTTTFNTELSDVTTIHIMEKILND